MEITKKTVGCSGGDGIPWWMVEGGIFQAEREQAAWVPDVDVRSLGSLWLGPWGQAAWGGATCSKVLRAAEKSASHSSVLVKAQRRRASHPKPALGVRSHQLAWLRSRH